MRKGLLSLLLFVLSLNASNSLADTLVSGQVGYINCTQATCAASATTFLVAPMTTLYRVTASVACASSGSLATAILIITYTDPSNTVQTITLPTAVCTTLGAGSISSLTQGITMSSNTNVQYSVTTALSPNYQVRVAVYQEGVN